MQGHDIWYYNQDQRDTLLLNPVYHQFLFLPIARMSLWPAKYCKAPSTYRCYYSSRVLGTGLDKKILTDLDIHAMLNRSRRCHTLSFLILGSCKMYPSNSQQQQEGSRGAGVKPCSRYLMILTYHARPGGLNHAISG